MLFRNKSSSGALEALILTSESSHLAFKLSVKIFFLDMEIKPFKLEITGSSSSTSIEES